MLIEADIEAVRNHLTSEPSTLHELAESSDLDLAEAAAALHTLAHRGLAWEIPFGKRGLWCA